MEKKIVKVDEGIMEMLEALYQDYRAKQDMINSIIDLHKFDEDGVVIYSAPFRAYEKEFAIAKAKYDEAMKEVQSKYVPEEMQQVGCRWEADFRESEIVVTPL